MLLAGLWAAASMARAPNAAWRWPLPQDVTAPPVPADNPMAHAKIALGRRLFYDADLSIDGTMACATCHEQKHGFADGNMTHAGVHGEPGRRNVPGLANLAWLPRLTWADPSQQQLEEQIAVPLFGTAPVEMGMAGQAAEIGRRLGADGCYRAMFAAAFPERQGAIDMATVGRALAVFQRTLLSFDSPYDRYRRGANKALSPSAQRGARLFFGTAGCSACHDGPAFSDGAYHRLGTIVAGPDRGLAEKSGRAEDEGKFRTPSLRNTAVTGPWLHDGSAPTLADALRRHGPAPERDQQSDLLAFLDSLTDRHFLSDRRFALPDRACGRRL